MAARGDVNLVIRAKDEAAKAFQSVAAALAEVLSVGNKVADGAERTGDRLSELAATTVALDRVYSQIAGAADRAAAAFNRQAAGIDAAKAQLAALKQQAAQAQTVLARLNSADAKVEAGLAGKTGERFEQIRELTRVYDGLVEQQQRLQASIATQEAALSGQRTALQQLGSTAIAAEQAQSRLAAETILVTDALQSQALAADRLSDIQQRINRATGVSRGDATGSAARAADLLLEADARFENIQKLRAQEAATRALTEAQEAQARATAFLIRNGSGKSAKDSAAVFLADDERQLKENVATLRRAAAAEDELAAAAARLRAQTDPIAAVQARLAIELEKTVRLYRAGAITAEELARAQKFLQAESAKTINALRGNTGLDSRGRPSLFGLKPYELQNLGYQVNDVFTQLASGTPILQVLAQQAGQILQLFPKVGASIAAALSSPVVLSFAAALGIAALAIRNVFVEADRLRTFEAALVASADGARYQASALSNSAKTLDLYGTSAEDAIAVIRTFQREGLAPDRIDAFARSAKDLADILGIDVKDAAKQVADAFTGGFEAIKKLDDATGFLTATEREYIRTLFAQGDAADARTFAFEKFYNMQSDAAEQMRGPWSEAVRALEGAWSSFIALLSDSGVIQTVAGALQALADGVTAITGALGAKTLPALEARAKTVFEAMGIAINRVDDLKQQQANGAVFSDSLFITGPIADEIADGERRIAELREEWRQISQEILQLRSPGSGTGGLLLNDTEAQAKQDADLLRYAQERADAQAKLTKEYSDSAVAARLLRFEEKARLELQEKFPLASNEKIDAEVAAEVARERLRIQKEIAEQTERTASAEERAIKAAAQKIIGIESSGDPNARNNQPGQTATGLGQFIESTWLKLFRKYFPSEVAGMSEDAILALRTDAEISKRMVEVYARENAEVLKKAGLSVTEANLALSHFLGPSGAVAVLTAAADTPIEDILSDAVIKVNKSRLQGKTAGQVVAEQQMLVAETGGERAAIQARMTALAAQQAKAQRELNEGLDQQVQKLQAGGDALERQKGLTGVALLEEQKRQAVAEALLVAQQQQDRVNADLRAKGLGEVALSEERKNAIAAETAAYFELSKAKEYAAARRDEVQQPVDDLLQRRDAILAQIESYSQQGESALAASLEPALAAVNAQLDAAIAKAIQFYDALKNNPETLAALGLTAEQIQVIIDKLGVVGPKARNLGNDFVATGKEINQQFASMATSAIDRFAQAVAEGENVLGALRDAFLQFAADFLRYIAQMIIQQLIFNLISGGGSGEGGLGGWISGQISHSGGVAGESTRSRNVDPIWFANARRMHTGGIAGLAPNEVPAILERGETIRTEEQEAEIQRQLAAGQSGSMGTPSIKIVNAFNEADVVSAGLNTDVGEKALINRVRNNPQAFKQALGLI